MDGLLASPQYGERWGRHWLDLARYAESEGFDLVAVSTHGHSGFRRLIMGSVAEKILRHVHVPVLVFPRQS